jgi:hypothetical protein
MILEQDGKDLEGNGRGPIEVLFRKCTGGSERNHEIRVKLIATPASFSGSEKQIKVKR